MSDSHKSQPQPKSPAPDTTDQQRRFGDGIIAMDHDTVRKHHRSK